MRTGVNEAFILSSAIYCRLHSGTKICGVFVANNFVYPVVMEVKRHSQL